VDLPYIFAKALGIFYWNHSGNNLPNGQTTLLFDVRDIIIYVYVEKQKMILYILEETVGKGWGKG